MLGAPAGVVRHGEGGVVVEAGGREVAAGRAILAVPPAIAGRIGYRPAMPGWRNQRPQRVPMGSVIKVHALYDEPFWRREGLSGLAVSDNGPVRDRLRQLPRGRGRPGCWSASSRASRPAPWARRNRADRRAGILACLTDYFGEAGPAGPGSCWSGPGPTRSTAAAATPATSRPGSGPPSVRPFESPWVASTGPGPRPPPSGPPTWRAPSSRRAGRRRGPRRRVGLRAEVVPGQARQRGRAGPGHRMRGAGSGG